jgi:hypothetical protein
MMKINDLHQVRPENQGLTQIEAENQRLTQVERQTSQEHPSINANKMLPQVMPAAAPRPAEIFALFVSVSSGEMVAHPKFQSYFHPSAMAAALSRNCLTLNGLRIFLSSHAENPTIRAKRTKTYGRFLGAIFLEASALMLTIVPQRLPKIKIP